MWADGVATTQTYVATVFREYDTSLQSLSVAWDGFSDSEDNPQPGSSTTPSYKQRIPNHIDSVMVTANLNVGVNATISLGNSPVTISTSTEAGVVVVAATISGLVLGKNIISIRVMPPVGEAAQYVMELRRRYSSQLSNLSIANTPLMPAFDPAKFQYEATVPNILRTSTATITRKQEATVSINGTEVVFAGESLEAQVPLSDLSISTNTISISVSAPDEEDTVYTIHVIREYSLNLQSLSVADSEMNEIAISPPFSTTASAYAATVVDTIDQVTVTFATDLDVAFELEASTQTLMSTTDRANGRVNVVATVALNFGENPITIKVSALDEEKVTTLRLTRLREDNADLRMLQLLPAALGFIFNRQNNRFVLEIPNPVVGDKIRRVELKAEVEHSDAMITMFTVDGAAAEGVSPDKRKIDTEIAVDEGETKTIIIEVTAKDRETTKSYTVMLTRPSSVDTRLSTLTMQPGGTPQGFVFDPASGTQATRYSVELPSDMASTTVTATANNALAMLTIRESTGSATAPSPSASLPVRIGEGEHKEIIIVVTAQSATTQTYRVIISRASAMDRSSLGFEVELTGVSFISSDTSSYIGELINANTERTVASASVDIAGVSVQHIRVGDTDYILGDTAQNLTAVAAIISKSIPVERRGTKITLVLRRTDNTEDGYTEENYIITIEASALRIRAKVFLEGPLQ